MKRAIILLGCAVVLALLAGLLSEATAAPSDDPSIYCADRTSYQSQLFCIEEETKAHERLTARGAIAPEIWNYCSGRSSWQTVEFCINSEEEAKRRLGR